MSAAVKCAKCNDSGCLPGSSELDCANCGAAVERAAVEKWARLECAGYVYAGDVWKLYQRGKAAGAAQAVPEGWQPIETAPMDGSNIILYLGAPWSSVELAYWYENWGNWQRMGDEIDQMRDEYCGIGSEIPTHWMPLPAAPKVP